MSSQGALSGTGIPNFGLIETFRWSPEEGYTLLNEHMQRLERSALAFGFEFRRDLVLGRLTDFAGGLDKTPQRVRLVLFQGQLVEISTSPLNAPPPSVYRVAIAGARHASGEPLLHHKTTLRDRYEKPLADAAASLSADEILFLNEHEELCEGARSNIFVMGDGQLLTPPLHCGLLPGTLRARLLKEGQAREATLKLTDIASDARWFMGNSVRGLVPARLIDDQGHPAS